MRGSSQRRLVSDLVRTLSEIERRKTRNRLRDYAPYQKQREFHAAGACYRERLFMAGNQLGKTWAGGFECAMHLTGRYPDWWVGRRYDQPVRLWAASVTGESTRDNPQRILLGPPPIREQWGTGTIPEDAIEDIRPGRNLSDAVDSVVVRHTSGGRSSLTFKAFGMGREKWQSVCRKGRSISDWICGGWRRGCRSALRGRFGISLCSKGGDGGSGARHLRGEVRTGEAGQ